ncbi:hypothetical protein EC973_008435, partial [Apophysomyces ossiformis]
MATSSTQFIFISIPAAVILLWLFIWSSAEQSSQLSSPLVSNSSAEIDIGSRTKNVADKQLCTPETFNNGQWIRRPKTIRPLNTQQFEKSVGYTCPSKFAHKCYQRNDIELQRSKKIVDYTWKPEGCTVLPFAPSSYAKHLSEHPLLLVGDSITQLQFESLACLLGEHLTSTKPSVNVTGGDRKIKVDQLSYRDSDDAAVAYLRSDYLLRLDDFKLIVPFEDEGDQLGKGHNFPWVHALPMFDYIVINTGPHWHPNFKWGPHQSESELKEAFKQSMRIVFDYLKEHIQQHQRVWIRSTPYGHANCAQFTSPQAIPFAPTGQPGEYEWHMFETFDHIWKASQRQHKYT